MSTARDNLMNRQGYSPYCGGERCRTMPRTNFNGEQFVCNSCGWESGFDKEFINEYKVKWKIGGKNENTNIYVSCSYK